MSARATTQHMYAIGVPDTSPMTFKRIRGVGNIGEMGSEATVHDSSSHDTDDGWGTIVMGLKRQVAQTFPVQYNPEAETHSADPDSLVGLLYLHEAVPAILMTFLEHPVGDPEHATTFTAYVTGFKRPVPVDGILQAMVTLTPTGKPEHVDASVFTIEDDTDEPFV